LEQLDLQIILATIASPFLFKHNCRDRDINRYLGEQLQVAVKVAADLSSLIPTILPFHGMYSVIGFAEARVGEK
jgi:hypothetical protein